MAFRSLSLLKQPGSVVIMALITELIKSLVLKGCLAFLQRPKGYRAVTRHFSHFSFLRPSLHFSGGHSTRPSPSGSVGRGHHVLVASGRNTSAIWYFGIIRRACEILRCALRKTLLGHCFLF